LIVTHGPHMSAEIQIFVAVYRCDIVSQTRQANDKEKREISSEKMTGRKKCKSPSTSYTKDTRSIKRSDDV
jgi:hypothetical protein